MDFPALLTSFAAAVEAHDGDALADCFTGDGVYEDYFFGASAPGRDGIKAMLDHFYEGGEGFRWEFLDPVASDGIGYASYRFSYASTMPEVRGARVVFEGIGRFHLRDGRIARYAEVFDRSVALAQLDFAPERLKKIALRYAQQLRAHPDIASHL